MDYFSSSEVPSLCLRDVPRTRAFAEAIRRTVKPGDTVLDAGAGSGILSFFAAKAGARHVIAAEQDETLAALLRANAKANGFDDIIEVIAGDVREIPLREPVNVVIAEMIETWLLDEHQVSVIDALRNRGIINERTRMIPESYEAVAVFGKATHNYYGFRLPFLIHDWPDLLEDRGWHPVPFRELSPPVNVFRVDFRQSANREIDQIIRFTPLSDGTITAVRLSGKVDLGHSIILGPTVAFNGDKIVPCNEIAVRQGQDIQIRMTCQLGGGLGSLRFTTD